MPLSKSAFRPTLAITPGEPAGVGPDLALTLNPDDFDANLIFVTDPQLMTERAAVLRKSSPEIIDVSKCTTLANGVFNIAPVPIRVTSRPGILDVRNASYVLETLETAVSLCESGRCQGLVTGPVNKTVINDAGIGFTGHTEWLQQRTRTDQVVMMLVADELRVALATTHLALREVADAIQSASLLRTLEIINHDLQTRFAIDKPRILVCGLNPHAGENGHLGHEEIDTIIPVLNQAEASGIDVVGPIPADTAFTKRALASVDVVLAMFHDKGLPVLKHSGFGTSVNVTLGLPVIRTSVDHGTALELAASGEAESGSLEAAIHTAVSMAQQQYQAS